MSITKLPSGRWRAQVYDPVTKRNLGVSRVLGGPGTFRTKSEAKAARERARSALAVMRSDSPTLREFWERWTSDPLYQRPKASTNTHNRERTSAFVAAYGSLQLRNVGDAVVAEWLRGGARIGTVPALRAMFNDALSAKAGRLIETNPFAGLGLKRSRGRRDQQPPSPDEVRRLIAAAATVASPGFAALLAVGCYTGLRPGELDALMWTDIDFARGRIHVARQFSATSKTFTKPKNGLERDAPLTPPAARALGSLPRESEWCFTSIRETHFTASSRAYHWKAVRAAAGWPGTFYLATKHFAGWYMINELRLSPEDVAVALGHTDGGQLVRTLYGHLDEERALDRVTHAYRRGAQTGPAHGDVRRRRPTSSIQRIRARQARRARADRPRDDPQGPK
jgi:integrase